MMKLVEIVCPECGCVFDHRAGAKANPRSPKHHKAFFYMIRVAEESWPEAYKDFQPDGLDVRMRREHLRAWLTCKAGWRTLIGEPLSPGSGVVETNTWWQHIVMHTLHHRKYVFPVEKEPGNWFAVTPRSIAEEECDPPDYRQVFDEVKALIEDICGIEIKFIPAHLRELEKVWGHHPGQRVNA
jgi:hypothetical protein